MGRDKSCAPDDIKGQFERRRFSRKDLTQLKLRAEWLARQPGQNWIWVDAYEALAKAADATDALIYRAQGMAADRRDDEEWDDDVDAVLDGD